ncbi:MAG: ABC transporter permease subunit [Propionibacteriaceae bacterium]|jgi:NitT/TauT family transport system permease protein|nr:ABC transporter permease subunit [Propionibacteriaceae bacterium]
MTSTTALDKPWVRGLVAAAFWLAVWQVAALLLGNTVLLASPVDVVAAFAALAPTWGFWASVGYSVARIASGFLIAACLGTVLAWAASLNRWAQALLSPPIRAIRSVPVVSFIILVLIWADSSWLSVTISALMVLPIIFANVEEGIGRRDAALAELAQVFGFSRSRRWWGITLPGVLPYFTAACRVGLGLAWKAGVSAEVIGLPDGSIGERLYQAKLYLATGDLFCWTAVIVACSFAFEKLALGALSAFESSLTRGYAK